MGIRYVKMLNIYHIQQVSKYNTGEVFKNSRDSKITFRSREFAVYGGLDCRDIIFDGQGTSEKRINLLYDDVNRHYHVIANLTGVMVKRYVCKDCNKGCSSGVTHESRDM